MTKINGFIILTSLALMIACSSKKKNVSPNSSDRVNQNQQNIPGRDDLGKESVTMIAPTMNLGSIDSFFGDGNTIREQLPQAFSAYQEAMKGNPQIPNFTNVNKALQQELPKIGIQVIEDSKGQFILRPQADENGLVSNPFAQELVKAGQSGVQVYLMDNTNSTVKGDSSYASAMAYVQKNENYKNGGQNEDNLSDYFYGTQLGTERGSSAVINPLLYLGEAAKEESLEFGNPVFIGTLRHEIGVHGSTDYLEQRQIYNPYNSLITSCKAVDGYTEGFRFDELPAYLINANTIINSDKVATKLEMENLKGYVIRAGGFTDTMYATADYIEEKLLNYNGQDLDKLVTEKNMTMPYTLKDGSAGTLAVYLPQLSSDSSKEEILQAGLDWVNDIKARCVWADENLKTAYEFLGENGEIIKIESDSELQDVRVQWKGELIKSKDKYDDRGFLKGSALNPKAQAKLAELIRTLPPTNWAPMGFSSFKPITQGSLGIAEMGKIFDSMNRSSANILSVNEAIAQANLGILKDDFKLFTPDALAAAQHSIDISLGTINDFESSNVFYDTSEQNAMFTNIGSFMSDMKFNMDYLGEGIQNTISFQNILDVLPAQFSDFSSNFVGASLGSTNKMLTGDESKSFVEAAKLSGIATTDISISGKSYTKINLPVWFGGVTLRVPHQ